MRCFAAVLALSLGACTESAPQEPEPTPEAKAPATENTVETIEKPPVDEPPPLDEPAAQPTTRHGQMGEKLNPEIAGIGTDAFEAVFPEQAGGLERTDLQSASAGTAGMWADSGSATYGEGEAAISTHVGDMIRVSECKPGTWDRHIDKLASGKIKEPNQSVVTVGRHRAFYAEVTSKELGTVRALNFRLGDRCDLELSSYDTTKKQLIAVAQDLALDELEITCAKREEGGPFGL